MEFPLDHRWFRYSAGFSADWVGSIIREYRAAAVLDPFAGCGTTLLAAEQAQTISYGIEAHPFVTRIAEAKLSWESPIDDVASIGRMVLEEAQTLDVDVSHESPLILTCFTRSNLEKLCSLRNSFLVRKKDMAPAARNMIWLAITTILRPCSHVGTAQ